MKVLSRAARLGPCAGFDCCSCFCCWSLPPPWPHHVATKGRRTCPIAADQLETVPRRLPASACSVWAPPRLFRSWLTLSMRPRAFESLRSSFHFWFRPRRRPARQVTADPSRPNPPSARCGTERARAGTVLRSRSEFGFFWGHSMRIWLAATLILGLAATARAEEADSTAAPVVSRPRPRVAAPT